MAVTRDDEPVGQHGGVGRATGQRDGREERGLEPPAVLVVAFEVHDGDRGPRRVGIHEAVVARPQDRRVGDARVEPHVEDVLQLLEVRPAAGGAGG